VKKVIIAITVRTSSKRLKKKAFLKIGNKKIIEWCIFNCKRSNIKNRSIILTTTCKKEDLKFKKIAQNQNISFFRGSEKNVVNRLLRLLILKKADYLIRVTGDSPLVDCNLINELQNEAEKGYDFIYFKNGPLGIKPELISKSSLIKLSKYKATKNCEYLSLFYKNNIKKFKIMKKEFYLRKKYGNLRLNVDYKLDFDLHKKIFNKFGQKFYNPEDIIKLSEKNKFITNYNSKIRPIYEKGELAKKLSKLTKIN
jgi:spore coat polysaccharide biosynthesis protein SpsF